MTIMSAHTAAQGELGWKNTPLRFISPHLRARTNSKSSRAFASSAWFLAMVVRAASRHVSVIVPLRGVLNPMVNPPDAEFDWYEYGSVLLLRLPVTKGAMVRAGPGQDTPIPNVVTGYGPCSTCTAWFVTLPVADAVGPAMLVFCGGASASAGVDINRDNNKAIRFIV